MYLLYLKSFLRTSLLMIDSALKKLSSGEICNTKNKKVAPGKRWRYGKKYKVASWCKDRFKGHNEEIARALSFCQSPRRIWVITQDGTNDRFDLENNGYTEKYKEYDLWWRIIDISYLYLASFLLFTYSLHEIKGELIETSKVSNC